MIYLKVLLDNNTTRTKLKTKLSLKYIHAFCSYFASHYLSIKHLNSIHLQMLNHREWHSNFQQIVR